MKKKIINWKATIYEKKEKKKKSKIILWEKKNIKIIKNQLEFGSYIGRLESSGNLKHFLNEWKKNI